MGRRWVLFWDIQELATGCLALFVNLIHNWSEAKLWLTVRVVGPLAHGKHVVPMCGCS
jgi:hypothetical protein